MKRAIPRSRTKVLALALGSAAFVALGVALVAIGGARVPIGVVTIAFFGAALGYAVRLMFRGGPGLVLDERGFDDRSSRGAVGFVPWGDVRELAVLSIAGQTFLAVRARDPAVYAARGGRLVQAAHRANIRLCGTPITISANQLAVSFDELVRLFEAGVARR